MPKNKKDYAELPIAALRSTKLRAVGRAATGTKRSAAVQFAGETAADALKAGEFGKGREVVSLSIGQWDLCDWIDACVSFAADAEPPDLTICTWAVSAEAIDRVHEWKTSGRLKSCRWIIETTNFWNVRYRRLSQQLRDCFGAECIAPLRVHAKFGLIRAGAWRVVAMSSANLNRNPRIELFHAADDAALFDVLDGFAADTFAAASGVKLFQHVNARLKHSAVKAKADALGLPRLTDLPLS